MEIKMEPGLETVVGHDVPRFGRRQLGLRSRRYLAIASA